MILLIKNASGNDNAKSMLPPYDLFYIVRHLPLIERFVKYYIYVNRMPTAYCLSIKTVHRSCCYN